MKNEPKAEFNPFNHGYPPLILTRPPSFVDNLPPEIHDCVERCIESGIIEMEPININCNIVNSSLDQLK